MPDDERNTSATRTIPYTKLRPMAMTYSIRHALVQQRCSRGEGADRLVDAGEKGHIPARKAERTILQPEGVRR